MIESDSSLLSNLAEINDPRVERQKRHLLIAETVIAVDGKTLRRSHDKSNGKSAIHMVSAWASDMNMVLGQIKTNEKSNEITAIPELLDLLDISGSTITIDAMGCQKKIAKKIIDNNANYALVLKQNHGDLYDDGDLFFQSFKKTGVKELSKNYFESVDGDHGRVEVRRHWVTSDIDWIVAKPLWTGLQSIGMVERERHIKDKISCETSIICSATNVLVKTLLKGYEITGASKINCTGCLTSRLGKMNVASELAMLLKILQWCAILP